MSGLQKSPINVEPELYLYTLYCGLIYFIFDFFEDCLIFEDEEMINVRLQFETDGINYTFFNFLDVAIAFLKSSPAMNVNAFHLEVS